MICEFNVKFLIFANAPDTSISIENRRQTLEKQSKNFRNSSHGRRVRYRNSSQRYDQQRTEEQQRIRRGTVGNRRGKIYPDTHNPVKVFSFRFLMKKKFFFFIRNDFSFSSNFFTYKLNRFSNAKVQKSGKKLCFGKSIDRVPYVCT